MLKDLVINYRSTKDPVTEISNTEINMFANVLFKRGRKWYSVPVRKQYYMKKKTNKSLNMLNDDFVDTCQKIADTFTVKTDYRIEPQNEYGKKIKAERIKL